MNEELINRVPLELRHLIPIDFYFSDIILFNRDNLLLDLEDSQNQEYIDLELIKCDPIKISLFKYEGFRINTPSKPISKLFNSCKLIR